MELEKIRAADTAVRWQHDDDVDNCPSCKNAFSVTRRKVQFTWAFSYKNIGMCLLFLINIIFIGKLDKLSALRHNILRQMFNQSCSDRPQ